jgi:uncharacterized DUF497 family protein
MIDWDQEKKDFLRSYCRDYDDEQLAILFNLQFGTSVDAARIRSARKRYQIRRGTSGQFTKGSVPWNKGKHVVAGGRSAETRFRKGRRPHTWVAVGTITEDRDGYLKQKVSDDQVESRFNWRFVHVLKWEEYNGREVPKGHCVRFMDMDKRNFAPDNLVLVSQAENCVINRWSRLDQFPEDARPVVINMAKLKVLMSRRSREERERS